MNRIPLADTAGSRAEDSPRTQDYPAKLAHCPPSWHQASQPD